MGSELKVNKFANYNAQTNAAGDTVVDYINHKREIEVGIICVDDEKMKSLLDAIDPFTVLISFRNPQTGELEENMSCIIPDSNVEYYTIQAKKVMFKALKLKFTQL